MNEKDSIKVLTAKNLEAEAEAIKKYYPLVDALELAGDKEGADIVREIISDEKNHLNLLQVILMHHDGEICIAADKIPETLDFLSKHLCKDE